MSNGNLVPVTNLGYACINETLKAKGIFTGRTARKATITKPDGSIDLDKISRLALLNCKDLARIMNWNAKNNIKLYRISSDLIPWMTEFVIEDLPDYEDIRNSLQEVGTIADNHNIRLTTHPGPFHCLASPNPVVVDNTIISLEKHAEIFDLIGLEHSPYNAINIHVGGAYNDKKATAKRFTQNFDRLSIRVSSRLTVENDDKLGLYSVKELYELIYLGNTSLNIPIVLDIHHHQLHPDNTTLLDAFHIAKSTWPYLTTPLIHYSESKRYELTLKHQYLKEDVPDDVVKIPLTAHSNYIRNIIPPLECKVDCMVEAKQKELAVLKYRDIYLNK